MRLTSPAFADSSSIPKKYGMDYENVNPPLHIVDVPPGTVSMALVMDDPDVPAAAQIPVWDHWVVFNIPPDTLEISEGWKPTGVLGAGTRGEIHYMGPRPPDREHRYFFRVYALDVMLPLPAGATKRQVSDAMDGHVLASAELMGRFAPE